jgi:hypothetical protein
LRQTVPAEGGEVADDELQHESSWWRQIRKREQSRRVTEDLDDGGRAKAGRIV